MYVHAQLFHTQGDHEWRSKTVKAKDVPGMGVDVMWNETFEWEFLDDPFAFIR
jgi:phosphatidylinositol phospholipase C delta